MADIEWTRRALKQLSKIDQNQRPRIVKSINQLTDFRKMNNVNLLVNHRYDYRLRVGSYRVLFDFTGEDQEQIVIQEVKKRDECTY